MDQTTETVALVGWRKQEGEAVVEGEVVCEIETDKATVEIPAPASGRLRKILVQAGAQVPPRTVVALIGESDEPLPTIDPFYRTTSTLPPSVGQARTRPPIQAQPQAVERTAGQKLAVSPRAKRLADQHGVDLATVRGTGQGGRIVEEDVQKAVSQVLPARTAVRPADTAMAERVSRSWQSIPHFYTSITIDLSRIVDSAPNASITLTDHFALAIAHTLELNPALNGHWVDDHLAAMAEIRLGLAVDTDKGLIVPALPDLRGKSLGQVSDERRRLVEQARAGRLRAEDMATPTFTLSNLGAGHIDQFTAIISPPQVGILSVGSVQSRAFVIGTEIVSRPAAVFTLGADHRAVDGRQAARFLEQLKTLLEAGA